MPRLKDLKDQQLYRIDRGSSHGAVDVLYRGTVDVALIRDQYDALVRIASSLRNRTAPAHVVLERLAASSDRPARALTMLGRIVKTIYILRYLQDAAVRDRVQRQLNRGESRHELARRLFFANQGAFRTGDYEEIMNKVSAPLAKPVQIYGNLKAGALVLEGEVHRQDGQVIHQRITWKAEGKGVRESAVMSRMAARPGRRRSTCCS